MGLNNTHGIFVLARSYVLTNAIGSQEDTTECKEKFELFDQIQYIVKHLRFVNKWDLTDLTDRVLQVKTRSVGEYKAPPPQRLCRMIQAISCWKDAERWKLIGAIQPLLPPEEPNLCDNFISKEPSYFDCFHIDFPWHCVFGHVLLDSDPLNDVDSWKEVFTTII